MHPVNEALCDRNNNQVGVYANARTVTVSYLNKHHEDEEWIFVWNGLKDMVEVRRNLGNNTIVYSEPDHTEARLRFMRPLSGGKKERVEFGLINSASYVATGEIRVNMEAFYYDDWVLCQFLKIHIVPHPPPESFVI